MTGEIQLSGVTLSSRDPRRLADFYRRLLDLAEADQDSPGWVSMVTPSGVRLSFHLDEHFVPPVWPTTAGQQQMTVHVDFDVRDLAAACEHAVRLGARLADFQPQSDVRVLLDPDGHPFCLAELRETEQA
jgi:catechol 2,3-dioxygenase-like lactoylglutathione lyase family enzyme